MIYTLFWIQSFLLDFCGNFSSIVYFYIHNIFLTKSFTHPLIFIIKRLAEINYMTFNFNPFPCMSLNDKISPRLLDFKTLLVV